MRKTFVSKLLDQLWGRLSWQLLPSTHVHLLIVELRPVYLVLYTWYQLLKGMAIAGMLRSTYAPALQVCADATAHRSILFHDFMLHCGLVPAHFMPDVRDGARFFYLFYMTVVSALGLIAWCEYQLVNAQGIRDFKHFKYCLFTRDLEESREFKVLAAIFVGPPAAFTLALAIYGFSAWVSSNDKLHWLPIWSNHIADIGLLCYAIKLILCPSLLTLAQSNFKELEDKVFERSPYEMLTQSNHAFVVKVWDGRLAGESAESDGSHARIRKCKSLEKPEQPEQRKLLP
mmetsp:Transcript_96063/g.222708  ORF Transcript_96063/g.222708 Transcript_96063/m.222708 type:complete len:287 (-) Transcript_96063:125-985(-)